MSERERLEEGAVEGNIIAEAYHELPPTSSYEILLREKQFSYEK